jgi:hypothetical protein
VISPHIAFLVIAAYGIYNERLTWKGAAVWFTVVLAVHAVCLYAFGDIRVAAWATMGVDLVLLLVVADWENMARVR